jgi:hypothetical protein
VGEGTTLFATEPLDAGFGVATDSVHGSELDVGPPRLFFPRHHPRDVLTQHTATLSHRSGESDRYDCLRVFKLGESSPFLLFERVYAAHRYWVWLTATTALSLMVGTERLAPVVADALPLDMS